MADLRNQLAEIYVKVVADTKAADKSLKESLDKSKTQLQGLQDLYDKSAKAQEKLSKLSEEQAKKQSKRILKEFGLSSLMDEKRIKNLKDLQKRYEDLEKRRVEEAKKNSRKIERVEEYIQKKLIQFRDYAGKLDDEELKKTDARNNQRAASYESFLKRASSEHSRYAARLDQRDMTASTLENLRRGFEKGMLISNKWHRDENTLQRVARGIEVAGTAFHKIRGPAQMAALRFQTMQRAAYALQAVIGSIAGSIGALIGGLMALVGVLGQASYALIAIGSSFASIGAGAIAARLALGGVGQAVSGLLDQQNAYNRSLRDAKRAFRDLRFEVEEAALSEEEAAINLERAREELARVQDLPPDTRARREAELQFQQAELAYRRAKARSKDAREDLKKGPLGGRGVQDPLAKLTASQKVFAKYLASLKPQLDTLKEAAASGFLPILQQAISILVAKALPTLTIGLNTLGTAMGNAAKSFSEAFTTPENLELLREFFESSRPLIETFGRAAGNIFGGILGVLKAAQPLTERFGKWIEKSSEDFEKWGKSEGLESFLNLAGDVAASLGGVIKSVFGGLKNIIDATFPGGDVNAGAGGVMLRWLQAIADGFKAFTGNKEFGAWLQGATANATTALSAIGTLLKPITDIAAMPEIGEFWTVLRGAAEPIKKLLEDGAKAGPEFAALLVSLTRLFAAFSDSGALEAFFNTLKAISDLFVAIFENPVVKAFLDFIGRIHGAFLAIGLALIVIRGLLLVFSGIGATVFKTVGGIAAAMGTVSVKTIAANMRFKQLRADGATLGQALNGVVSGFTRTARQAAATRRAALLVQMAKDAGMAKKQLDLLEMQLNDVIMKQGIYSRGGMVAAVKNQNAQLSQSKALNAASAGTRFGGGRAATGLAGGAMMLGSMASGGSALTSGLATTAMIASFLPGPLGLISGAVLGIGAAISSGFDAAAQAEKEKEEKKQQLEIAINAKNAQITAEKLDTQITAQDALAAAGIKATDWQRIIDESAKKIGAAYLPGVVDNEKAFSKIASSGFAGIFGKGTEKQQQMLLDNIKIVMRAQAKTFDQAVDIVAPVFKEGGEGGKGINAVSQYIKDTGLDKIITTKDRATGDVFAGTPAEVAAKEAEYKAAAEARSQSREAQLKAEPIKAAIADLNNFWSMTNRLNSNIWNEDVFKAVGVKDANEFSLKYGNPTNMGVFRDKLKDDLKPALDRYLTAAFGPASGITGKPPVTGAPGTGNNYGPPVPPMPGIPGKGSVYGPPVPLGPYIPPSMSSSITAAARTANTTSNAAATMSNAANVLANVANVATKQPTYIIYSITGGKPITNALDIFAGNGVTPIPYSGVYP